MRAGHYGPYARTRLRMSAIEDELRRRPMTSAEVVAYLAVGRRCARRLLAEVAVYSRRSCVWRISKSGDGR